jgi:perosamine synthetase
VKIPLAYPDLTGNEEKYVVEAIRTSWISSTGPFIKKFEDEFAANCQTRAAISVCNGTVALHLALLALEVKPQDEVIVPSLTYIATANAVKYVGAVPVFVDVDPQTWCIDPERLQEAITPNTKGIIVVHLYGHPADMDAINRIADSHGLWVVEDAAEAPFAAYKGKATGGLGRIGIFSFYGNKVISSGEGGALTLSDRDLEARARMLRGQGMDPQRRYYFPITGYNFRLTNIACALLCAQLERREQILSRRRELFACYSNMLKDVTGISLQPVAPWAVLSPWLFSITIGAEMFGCSRDVLMSHLADAGIETRPFFVPLHTLPPFEEFRRSDVEFPVTNALAATGINLPTYSGMTTENAEFICEAILNVKSNRC